MAQTDASAFVVVALLCLGAACAGDESRQRARSVDAEAIATAPPAPPALAVDREPTTDDAGICDDHGAVLEVLVLALVPESDPCRQDIARLPMMFEPQRLAIELDGARLQRDADGYRLEGDVIVLLGGACDSFNAADAGKHRLSAKYGPCWPQE